MAADPVEEREDDQPASGAEGIRLAASVEGDAAARAEDVSCDGRYLRVERSVTMSTGYVDRRLEIRIDTVRLCEPFAQPALRDGV